MTMTEEGSRFAAEEEEVVERPSIHPLAAISLLLAALGMLSIWWLVWLLAALIAALLAIIAVRAISASQGQYQGTGLAGFSLCVSLLLLGHGLTDWMLHERFMAKKSDRVAREWLQYLSDNEMEAAHHLTMACGARADHGMPLAEYYVGDHAKDLKEFQLRPQIRALAGAKFKSVEMLSAHRSVVAATYEQYRQEYRVTAERDGATTVVAIGIVTERGYRGHIGWCWRVADSNPISISGQ